MRSQEKYSLIHVISEYNDKELIVFNVIESGNKIYIGTSLGAFELNSKYKIEKVSEITGPIGKVGNNLISVKNQDISRTDKYQYLSILQDLNQKEDPFLKLKNTLFLVVGAKLRIYQKLIEQKYFSNYSIRSISENFIGSYDGIITRSSPNRKISDIETDSHIREINNRIFICYSGLAEYKNDQIIYYHNELEEFEILGESYGFIRDISSTNRENQFIIYTTMGVYLTDLETFVEPITISNSSIDPLNRLLFPKHIKTYFDKDYNDRVLFFANKKLYLYFFNSKRLQILKVLEANIYDSFISESGLYFLDEFHLSIYNSNKGISKISINNNYYHSFVVLNEQRAVLISDIGVWLYDLNHGYENLLSDEEFNYGAKYLSKDSLFLGGINGISSFKIDDLLNYPIISRESVDLESENIRIIYLGIFLILLLLPAVIFLLNKNRSRIEYVDQNKLIQLEIEAFIESKISSVTINLIKETFNVSYGKLNKFFAPKTVAQIIKDKRINRVKEGLEKRLTIEEISEFSGYSVTYLKRLLAKRRI